MSVRTLIVLILAIVCCGSAAAGILLMRNSGGAKPPDTIAVVVSRGDITRGQIVTDSLVTTRAWPKDLVPPNAVFDLADAVGRTALHHIMTGEAVLDGKLAHRDAGRGLASLIPDGRRAYAIQTSHVASNVAGFVLPGNRVDVLLTLRGGPNDSTGGGSSTTLLQAVEILAVDQQLDAPDEKQVAPQHLRSVTLLVTPDQASLLDLGQNMGTLTLSLRNPEDTATAETVPATVNILRFTQRDAVPDGVDGSANESFFHRAMKTVAAAAATVPQSAAFGSLTAADMNPSLPDVTPETTKKRYGQIHTLRGRHPGRILVRKDR